MIFTVSENEKSEWGFQRPQKLNNYSSAFGHLKMCLKQASKIENTPSRLQI